MKHTFSAALAALAIFSATPAAAADMAPLPNAFDWTGLHIGLGVGGNYGFSDQQGDVFLDETYKSETLNLLRLDLGNDGGNAGFMGTIEGGYDYQFATDMVMGIAANYDFGKVHIDSADTLSSGLCRDCSAGIGMSTDIGDSWAVVARLGWLPAERTLIYALGGFSQADVSQDGSIYANLGGQNVFKESVGGSGWQSGWVVGGGIETMLFGSDNWSGKLEYRYADYGSLSAHREEPLFQGEGGSINVGGDRSDNVTVHSVRAVVSYRLPL